MNTLLTLVIALGGIATGIGAIWTAMLARCQLNEQRLFLKEQIEIARHQVQATEHNLREQDERARLNLAVDLLFRHVDRFESQLFLSRRRAAARYLLDNAFPKDDCDNNNKVGVERLNGAALRVCGFFEDLAHLQRIEALPTETVWNSFGSLVRTYWSLCKSAIEKDREEWGVPAMNEEFEHLSRVFGELEGERGIEPPTKEQLRQVMEDEVVAGEDEAILGEEPPAMTE